jgi:hypothetical protein
MSLAQMPPADPHLVSMDCRRLRDLQRDLQQFVLGSPSAIMDTLVDAPPWPAADRLGIYRHAYEERLLESLDDTYPKLRAALGDEDFAALGRAFIAAHPSVQRSIRWYGRELAAVLANTAPYDEQPILAELASLEWTLSEVFDAADATPLTRAALSEVPPEDWSGLRFGFHPSLRRLTLSWNTPAVWSALGSDGVPPNPERLAAPETWLLWRRDLKNYFRSMTAAEAAALDAAIAGRDFGELCAELCEWLPAGEIPLAAANFLAAWTDGGLIVALSAGLRS